MTEKQLQKRKNLQEISKTALAINKATGEEFEKVNDMIINFIYNKNNKLKFNTYKSWKKEGYQVKKGETAFLIWGRPLKELQDQEKAEPEKEEEENKSNFFPVAHIFSSEQVRKI